MKAIVIYRSKTGFTQRYAQWIAEELSCEAIPFREAHKCDLSGYDTIIYGAGFHAGMIPGAKKFISMPALAGKRLVVFATGAMPAAAPDVAKALRQNFTDEQWERVKAFYLQAGLNYERMSMLDRLMMKAFCSMVKKQEGEDSEMYRMVSTSYDLCDRMQIAPMVEYCRQA